MKINAVDVNNSALQKFSYRLKVKESADSSKLQMISFKAGNKNQAILFVAETKPYFQAGGVATVMEDLRGLRVAENDPVITQDFKRTHDFYAQKNKAIVDSFYNGQVIYDTKTGLPKEVIVPKIPAGLPDESPFKKYEGKYFMTNNQDFTKYKDAKEFFEKEGGQALNKNIWILEDVTGPKKMLDFGGLGESEIKLFQVYREDGGKLKPTHDFKIFTDVMASWSKPYAGGGYSTVPGALSQTWIGDGDAKAAKAFVEFLPRITEVMSQDGHVFDPATIMLNDSQAAYAAEYMAEKSATGNEFWQGKKPTLVGHNLGDGYIQKTSYMNMFVNIADKELRNYIYHDPEYAKAAKEGPESVNRYFEALIPKEMKDLQNGVSPFKNALYYAEHGYLPTISTVSELYAEKLAVDPEFAAGTQYYLKRLADKGRFIGILNAFENVDMDPTTGGVGGYYKEYTFPAEAKSVEGLKIKPLLMYDAAMIREGEEDVKYIRDIKRQNKANLLERFDKDVLQTLKDLKNVKGHETDFNTVIAGLPKKEAKVYGYIRKDIIEEAKKPDSRVKMLAGWGRSDAQKALDSSLNGFVKYIKEHGKEDPFSVMFVGGPTADETKKCIGIIEKYKNDPDVAGRIVFIDSFLPAKPFASAADFTVFPSRFAPCELTDLESMKVFASPIVTNCQGLAQKNFDSNFDGELEKATGYKTKHEYFMSLDEIKKNLSDTEKQKLDNALKSFKKEINNPYRLSHGGVDMPDAEITKKILTDGGLNYRYNFEILRPFRDGIIENELKDCFYRALIKDNGQEVQDNMIRNHIKMKTDWERNGKLKKDGLSSADKYRKYHFQAEGKAVKKEETLLEKLRVNCAEAVKRAKKEMGRKGSGVSLGSKLTAFFHSKGGKWTLAGTGLAAILGLGTAVKLNGWFSYKDEEKAHVSAIV